MGKRFTWTKATAVSNALTLGGLFVLAGVVGIASLKSTGSNVNSMLQRVANTLDTIGGVPRVAVRSSSEQPNRVSTGTARPSPGGLPGAVGSPGPADVVSASGRRSEGEGDKARSGERAASVEVGATGPEPRFQGPSVGRAAASLAGEVATSRTAEATQPAQLQARPSAETDPGAAAAP